MAKAKMAKKSTRKINGVKTVKQKNIKNKTIDSVSNTDKDKITLNSPILKNKKNQKIPPRKSLNKKPLANIKQNIDTIDLKSKERKDVKTSFDGGGLNNINTVNQTLENKEQLNNDIKEPTLSFEDKVVKEKESENKQSFKNALKWLLPIVTVLLLMITFAQIFVSAGYKNLEIAKQSNAPAEKINYLAQKYSGIETKILPNYAFKFKKESADLVKIAQSEEGKLKNFIYQWTKQLAINLEYVKNSKELNSDDKINFEGKINGFNQELKNLKYDGISEIKIRLDKFEGEVKEAEKNRVLEKINKEKDDFKTIASQRFEKFKPDLEILKLNPNADFTSGVSLFEQAWSDFLSQKSFDRDLVEIKKDFEENIESWMKKLETLAIEEKARLAKEAEEKRKLEEEAEKKRQEELLKEQERLRKEEEEMKIRLQPDGARCQELKNGSYSIGMNSPNVKELQFCMKQAGVFSANITSYFGPMTNTALRIWRGEKLDQGVEATGKHIVISLSNQTMTAYENGVLVRSSPITSGKNGYQTVVGDFNIYEKKTNTTLISPFSDISYRIPVNYWMAFYRDYGIHDASWRNGVFGGGDYVTNGSHGCVNTPDDMVAWLYNWAPIGTKVTVTP